MSSCVQTAVLSNSLAGTTYSMDMNSMPVLASLPDPGLSGKIDDFEPCSIKVVCPIGAFSAERLLFLLECYNVFRDYMLSVISVTVAPQRAFGSCRSLTFTLVAASSLTSWQVNRGKHHPVISCQCACLLKLVALAELAALSS